MKGTALRYKVYSIAMHFVHICSICRCICICICLCICICRLVPAPGNYIRWGGGMGWDVDNDHVTLHMMIMKLVNSATKFRHRIDKFYKLNWGLRSSRSWDEAICTCICVYIYIYVCVCARVYPSIYL